MSALITIGEGMLELSILANGELRHKYAGDTLNAAIYAKRRFLELDVAFLTGIGCDLFSQQLSQYLVSEQLNNQLLLQTNEANLGIYAIQTDQHGERSFTYWRSGSAATKLMQLINASDCSKHLQQSQCIFFSGITLAILADQDKANLLTMLANLRQNFGCKIAFDPNYRARMWRDPEHAIDWITKAYQIADIVLPGLDEHQVLFNHQTVDEVKHFMQTLAVKELVIKAGKLGVFASDSNNQAHVAFNPAPKQVDTTGAGDSFAGVYLASRLNNLSILESITNADKVAREVVQHAGAIMDIELFKQRILNLDC